MSDYEDFLKWKEQTGRTQSSRSSANPAVILLILAVIAVIFVAPMMGGIGYASGGGEVRVFSPSNSSNVNGNYNTVVQTNGNRNSVNINNHVNRGVGGEECIVGGSFLFVILGGAVLLVAGYGFFRSGY